MATFTKTVRKHIFLHPMDKSRQFAAVKSALLQDKNKYSDRLEGSLLDVNNVKVIGDRYLIVNGYLSMEVIADFVVFSPQVGQKLEGVINKKSKSHLGCLVMDTFNAALHIPSSFGLEPRVGNSCTFDVTEVVVDGDILFLRGTLTGLTSYKDTAIKLEEMEDVLMEEDVIDDKNFSVKTENSHWAAEDESHIEKNNSDHERTMNVLPEEKMSLGSSKKKSKKSPHKVKHKN
ncbi:hypothetical protein BsWGS_19232 [Bradybaena similaris]